MSELGNSLDSGLLTKHRLCAKRLQDAMRRAVERLEPRLRRVIEYRYFGEASQHQTAAALGISQMHISRLERRALEQRRELLAEDSGRG